MIETIVVNALVTIGAVYGGLKASMNGLQKSQTRIETKLDRIDAVVVDHGERIVRLETLEETDALPP